MKSRERLNGDISFELRSGRPVNPADVASIGSDELIGSWSIEINSPKNSAGARAFLPGVVLRVVSNDRVNVVSNIGGLPNSEESTEFCAPRGVLVEDRGLQ